MRKWYHYEIPWHMLHALRALRFGPLAEASAIGETRAQMLNKFA
jgi:hypothetical protein